MLFHICPLPSVWHTLGLIIIYWLNYYEFCICNFFHIIILFLLLPCYDYHPYLVFNHPLLLLLCIFNCSSFLCFLTFQFIPHTPNQMITWKNFLKSYFSSGITQLRRYTSFKANSKLLNIYQISKPSIDHNPCLLCGK